MRYHVTLRLHFPDGTTREGTYVGLGENSATAEQDAMIDAWDAFDSERTAPHTISVVRSVRETSKMIPKFKR